MGVVSEVEKAALRERFGTISPEERDFELALLILETKAAHGACQERLFGNGKKGHVHRIYAWLGFLSFGMLLVVGKEGLPGIAAVIKWLISAL